MRTDSKTTSNTINRNHAINRRAYTSPLTSNEMRTQLRAVLTDDASAWIDAMSGVERLSGDDSPNISLRLKCTKSGKVTLDLK